MFRSKSEKFDKLKERCCNFTKLYGKAVDFNNIISSEVNNLIEDVSDQLITLEEDYAAARSENKNLGKSK